MKKISLILGLLVVVHSGIFAQDDDDTNDNERIRDKMNEYIQKRLHLSNNEAKSFSPLFLNYFKEWRKAIRDTKGDNILRQQKVADIQLRYRNQFRQVIGEERSNQVFGHQRVFIQELRGLRQERLRNGPPAKPLRRNR